MSCPEIRYVVVCWRDRRGAEGHGSPLLVEVAREMQREYERRYPDRTYWTREATPVEVAFVKG
jgi:hypothetical protein